MTVGELLETGAFRLPPFQRPYSWHEDTAVQLFDDVHSAMDAGAAAQLKLEDYEPYFLGPMIVVPDGRAPSDLVDGQQRLVTITSLLAIIRDKVGDTAYQEYLNRFIWRPPNPHFEDRPQPRIRLRELDQDRFQSMVQNTGGTTSLPDAPDTTADERLLTVLYTLKGELGHVADDYLRALSRFVLEKCVVLVIYAQSISTAYQIFRGINSRGQQLEPLDLVRAELLGAPTHEAPELADVWAEAEDVLGADELGSYVEAVLHSISPLDTSDDLAVSFRRVMSEPTKSVAFRSRMKDFLRAHRALEGGELDLGRDGHEINRRLLYIRHLPFDSWRAPLLLFMTRGPTTDDLLKFLQRLEAISFAMVIGGVPRGRVNRRFRDLAKVLTDGLDPFSASSPLTQKPGERTQATRRLEESFKPMPRFARYVLLRLNAEMCTPEIVPPFPNDITIEHVLPQSPRDPWLRVFPATNERNALTHRLGNLALLTHPINAAAKNRSFEQKKTTIFGTTNGNVFALTANITSYSEWNAIAIRNRQRRLVEVAERILAAP